MRIDCSTTSSRSSQVTRGGTAWRALRLAGSLALALPSLRAAVAAPPDAAAAPPVDALRVEVDPGIDDAAFLGGWITDRHPDLAEALGDPAGQHARSIAVRIAGSTYDYRVTVTALRDGEPLGSRAEPTRCECTTEELLRVVDVAIAAAVEQLRASPPPEPAAEAEALEPTATPATPAPQPRLVPGPTLDPSDARPGRLGALGRAGIGTSVVGAGLTTAGIVLATRPRQLRGEPGSVEIRDFRSSGIGLAVSGGVALATGVALLVIDRAARRRRTTAFIPVLRPGAVGVSLVRRF